MTTLSLGTGIAGDWKYFTNNGAILIAYIIYFWSPGIFAFMVDPPQTTPKARNGGF